MYLAIVLRVVVLATGGLTLALLFHRFMRKHHEKEILVIGGEAVGKSSLISFLGGKADPITQTQQPEGYQSFVVEHGGKKIHIKKGYDVPGSDGSYKTWKRFLRSADFVFYLIDTFKSEVQKHADYNRRLTLHADNIYRWLNEIDGCSKQPEKILIVGTHRDKFPRDHRPNQVPSCLETFRLGLGEYADRVEVFFGSLKDRTEAKKLIRDICKSLTDSS